MAACAVGLALYIAARSSGTRLYSPRLAWISLALINIAAIAGTITLAMGLNYGDQEYREWLWWIRVILGAGLVTAVWNMIATVAHRFWQRVVDHAERHGREPHPDGAGPSPARPGYPACRWTMSPRRWRRRRAKDSLNPGGRSMRRMSGSTGR